MLKKNEKKEEYIAKKVYLYYYYKYIIKTNLYNIVNIIKTFVMLTCIIKQ